MIVPRPSYVPALLSTSLTDLLVIARSGERVELTNIAPVTLEFGNTLHSCWAAVLRAIGSPLGYADLMGFSGQAFRMQVHLRLCASSPHSAVGYPTPIPPDATPLATVRIPFDVADEESIRALRQEVKESIDRWWPLLYGSEEFGLIVGYERLGKRWICTHPYHGDGDRYVLAELPWEVYKFVPTYGQSDPAVLAHRAIAQAVAMWDAGARGEYMLGPGAWACWIDWTLRAEGPLRDEGLAGDRWILQQLVEARTCASEFLRRHAEHLPSEALMAADWYDMMVRTLVQPVGDDRDERADRLKRAAELDHQAVQILRGNLALIA